MEIVGHVDKALVGLVLRQRVASLVLLLWDLLLCRLEFIKFNTMGAGQKDTEGQKQGAVLTNSLHTNACLRETYRTTEIHTMLGTRCRIIGNKNSHLSIVVHVLAMAWPSWPRHNGHKPQRPPSAGTLIASLLRQSARIFLEVPPGRHEREARFLLLHPATDTANHGHLRTANHGHAFASNERIMPTTVSSESTQSMCWRNLPPVSTILSSQTVTRVWCFFKALASPPSLLFQALMDKPLGLTRP